MALQRVPGFADQKALRLQKLAKWWLTLRKSIKRNKWSTSYMVEDYQSRQQQTQDDSVTQMDLNATQR
jgi:hypothetical protein